MKVYRTLFPIGQFAISLLFVACAVALVVIAGYYLWEGIWPSGDFSVNQRVNAILECIALLTIASAALELGQIIIEEEVLREAQMSAPTRVRRFLSRFMVVLVVSLSIEALVVVFRYAHDAPENLSYAATIGLTAAALLAAWGLFVRLNRSVEELEPRAMQEAQEEDEHLRS
jgi:hypothetical protein